MKVLEPTVTVMLASHMKPAWLPSTLDSILAQTRLDIEVVVADSGAWLRDVGWSKGHSQSGAKRMWDLYDIYRTHPLVTWVTLDQTWPTPLRERACPYAYVWNRIIEAGLVRGKYVAVFTDDDLYAPTFIKRMAGYLDEHPDDLAVYCGQDRARWEEPSELHPAGRWVPGMLHPGHAADRPRIAGDFHWQIDMTQVMFRHEMLDQLRTLAERARWPVFNEDPADAACRSADGEFLERLATSAGVVPNIPEVLVTHRYTPDSTYN